MPLLLTDLNYYSQEADLAFMSCSQYLGYLDCEARQQAILHREYTEPENQAFLVGSYVHSWNDGTMRQFVAEHPQCFKKDGGLKSEYVQANEMIRTLEEDGFCMFMLEGRKEVIVWAEFANVLWKIKIDVYRPDAGRFVDLKTARSITERIWIPVERRWASWVEHYGYVTRFAIYAEIERLAAERETWLNGYIVAIDKSDPYPDKAVISMTDPDRWTDELKIVRNNMSRLLAVKAGLEKPRRCEKCSYCRSTKVLNGEVISWRDL